MMQKRHRKRNDPTDLIDDKKELARRQLFFVGGDFETPCP
jgi:hypothetical protein